MTIVTLPGTAYRSIFPRPLTTEQFEQARRDLAHRAEQLSFDVGKWKAERQQASDDAGIREQLRYYGPAKVWVDGKEPESRRRARRQPAD